MAKDDPANGLYLHATLDALFDRHLISFDEKSGDMLIAKRLDASVLDALNSPRKLRWRLADDQARFMRMHREEFERRNG